MIDLRLDHASPTPLYHQIVQAIRWRIGTGVLRPGDPLPAIRDAAEQWGVNYHTVRRAYHELSTAGWVDSSPGTGTRVAQIQPADGVQRGDLIDEWLTQVMATAQNQYGLSAETLATLVRERQRTLRVVVVECNRHQAVTLSRQVERTLPVDALPWSLEEIGEPPEVPIIGTYFHHGEMRTRWPHRLADMHFVALTVDRDIEERVAAAAARRDAQLLWLVERDIGTAHEMATAVSAVLAPRYEIRPVVVKADELLNSLPENQLVLVAPRLWDELPPVVRADERVLAVEPVIIEHDLQRVWRSLKSSLVEKPDAAENRL
jgi:DNA-binding transcriptional regulator YhcF (GntR family)